MKVIIKVMFDVTLVSTQIFIPKYDDFFATIVMIYLLSQFWLWIEYITFDAKNHHFWDKKSSFSRQKIWNDAKVTI